MVLFAPYCEDGKACACLKSKAQAILLTVKRAQMEYDLNLSGQFGMVSASCHLI